ncbi:unnamed protein product [Staurois parvus]|uniref:Uncharacterized protein n=1 Tax=Staurois parvus TaxID=386267 RepID=A0ABN9C9J8_9NEOB|nr:unnamed protein product [Staurois parvus]CAI9556722.1 unnamed protein product [Staurois parvus]CAI9558501.1 unnamed protein product [Staurois parvus]CAI9598336.1 unnamed protein product [Staurois parvus]CAI9599829.1 unnamed protein product [Staurois parvus]
MPPIGSDLLLLTWRVTRLFSARCSVPHRPHSYRPGLYDPAPAQPSIHPSGVSRPPHTWLSPVGAPGEYPYH